MSAPVSEVDAALLAYAEKLTRRPYDMCADDLAALREAGLTDTAIHDAAQTISLFAYYNRMADGLGVEVADDG